MSVFIHVDLSKDISPSDLKELKHVNLHCKLYEYECKVGGILGWAWPRTVTKYILEIPSPESEQLFNDEPSAEEHIYPENLIDSQDKKDDNASSSSESYVPYTERAINKTVLANEESNDDRSCSNEEDCSSESESDEQSLSESCTSSTTSESCTTSSSEDS